MVNDKLWMAFLSTYKVHLPKIVSSQAFNLWRHSSSKHDGLEKPTKANLLALDFTAGTTVLNSSTSRARKANKN